MKRIFVGTSGWNYKHWREHIMAFFNNDAHGYAVGNALELRKLLGENL
ncbi:MAG: hypothetical protein KGK03_04110 [Candidatus Omnitrophica bacterium]|nr:hypothetical protein [Candidatus Omnitrophota bacterium]MDE2222237.1 hypothetical protein [Candidatus Omnitrophota bacterium]